MEEVQKICANCKKFKQQENSEKGLCDSKIGELGVSSFSDCINPNEFKFKGGKPKERAYIEPVLFKERNKENLGYRVKEITAETSFSLQIKDVWYRICYRETRELKDTANIQEERNALWDTVNSQCEQQYDELQSAENPDN